MSTKNSNSNNPFPRRVCPRPIPTPKPRAMAVSEPEGDFMNLMELQEMPISKLTELAMELEVEGVGAISKQNLVFDILKANATKNGLMYGGGVLEVTKETAGFLRTQKYNYLPCDEDIYVSGSLIKKFGLRTGDSVQGPIRPPSGKERYFSLVIVASVNNEPPEKKRDIITFKDLTPLFPDERLVMERDKDSVDVRVLDIVTPIGKGQRGLVVSAPRVGKTIFLKEIANSVARNNPEVIMMVLLIDERPEEVTDMERSVQAEVVSSTFDEEAKRHIQVAEMVLGKAQRLVEHGHDVMILLDSITRLARAYNTVEPHSGRVLTGGLEATSLYRPKRFFGAARNIEFGGSLTILATALVNTGSRMDDVIFEEFKGTGNMEIHLEREIAEARIYPAINIPKSGTRREDLLVHEAELEKMHVLRQALHGVDPKEAMKMLIQGVKKHPSNAEFLMAIKGGALS